MADRAQFLFISLLVHPQGAQGDPGGSKTARRQKPLKRSQISSKMPIFMRFWLLGALKTHGGIQNLEIQILWISPAL